MTAMRVIRYGAWGAIAALGIVIALVILSPGKRDAIAQGGHLGGPFQIAMATGGVLESASLKGKPYALFFGFTQCPDICPSTLSDMTALLDDLDKGELAAKAKDFRILFVTVDPERDTSEMLANYLSAFDNRIVGLVPKLDALPALAKQFAVFYQKVPTSSGYTMNHTSAVYLFNAEGVFAGTLSSQEGKAIHKAKLERLMGKAFVR